MKKIIYLILFLTLILVGCTFYQRTAGQVEFEDYEKRDIEKPESLEEMIIRKSKEANLDPAVSLRIARCESTMNPRAINKQGSSAKGLYQFVDKTWKNYCVGDPLNAEDSINCFIKLYKVHPTWWKC